MIAKKQIFFTLNGRFLGNAFSNVNVAKDTLYASVCLQSINEEIESNFIGSVHNEFKFDIEGFKKEIALSEYMQITEFPTREASMNKLIRSYLVHQGYIETLQALENDISGVKEADEGFPDNAVDSLEVEGSNRREQDAIVVIEEAKTEPVGRDGAEEIEHPMLETEKSEGVKDRRMTEDESIREDKLGLKT